MSTLAEVLSFGSPWTSKLAGFPIDMTLHTSSTIVACFRVCVTTAACSLMEGVEQHESSVPASSYHEIVPPGKDLTKMQTMIYRKLMILYTAAA
jgi:hypothetical protein